MGSKGSSEGKQQSSHKNTNYEFVSFHTPCNQSIFPWQSVMILGFDVYHCAQRKNQSVGALVSTISPNLARYYSTVSFHKDKSELSSNMCLDTKSKDFFIAIVTNQEKNIEPIH